MTRVHQDLESQRVQSTREASFYLLESPFFPDTMAHRDGDANKTNSQITHVLKTDVTSKSFFNGMRISDLS